MEKAIESSKPAYMYFVDLTQAFNRVRLCDIIKILKQQNIDPTVIALVKELNSNTKTRIKINHTLTEEVPVSTGIRQGDSLSPTLFSLVMDEIIKEIKTTGKGYKLKNNEIKIICYADDAVLISETEDDLQRMLFKFKSIAETFNMKISTNKTKSLTVSKEPLRCKLVVDDYPIEQVMEFNYLGANISSCRNLYNEVRHQATKAAAISGALNDIIWKNKYMSVHSKTRIYKTSVRPVMTYAGETRADTGKTKQLLRSTEMRTLRSINGLTLRDRIRSQEMRNKCEI